MHFKNRRSFEKSVFIGDKWLGSNVIDKHITFTTIANLFFVNEVKIDCEWDVYVY